jgi:hypothetical protein
MLSKRSAGVFFARVDDASANPTGLAFHLRGELFRRFQIGEPTNPANNAVRIAVVEIPAFRRTEILLAVLGDSVQHGTALLSKPNMRAAVVLDDFGIRREKEWAGRLEWLRHG